MAKPLLLGPALPDMPWEDKPLGCTDIMWRHSANPIIGRNPVPNTARVFNSALVPWKGGFIGVFRAEHRNGIPQLHVGRSKDGLEWELEPEEIRWKDESGADYRPTYSYDPRVVALEGKYYVIWCADFGGASLGLGVTEDFRNFTRLENPFIPFNRNGVLFPRKVGGKYLMLSRPSDSGHTPFGDVFLSESPDLVHWGRHRQVMTTRVGNWWQSVKIGAGAVPIETSEGWLLFYHGVTGTCNGFVYSIGAALLDLERPAKVLYRGRDHLLTPELPYETTGFVPNVCFPCATVQDPATDRIAVYYGAADTVVAVAYCKADELVAHIKANSALAPGDDGETR